MLLVLMELVVLGSSAVVEADIMRVVGDSSESVAVNWVTVSDLCEAGQSVEESKKRFRELDD
jgi:hypothetical protein